ncbi:MAG: hypothetical protein V4696_03675 [Pseudomonadota bacterium]
MAKAYLQVQREFTKRIGASTVVGHPEHRDIRGRYLEVDDVAQVDALVSSGHVKRISRAAYNKATESDNRPDAGETRVAQTSGKTPKVSATTPTAALHELAGRMQIDTAGLSRTKMISAINKKIDDGEQAEGAGEAKTAFERLAGLSADSTSHPITSSPQSPPPLDNQVDEKGEVGAIADAADAAPVGGAKNDE